jgi:hypothetical protein
LTAGENVAVTGGAGSVTIRSFAPAGLIFGCTLSNNGPDPTNDIDIAACEATSDDSTAANRVYMVGSAMTKQLDVAWAAGSAAGFRCSASLGNGTWHVFEFKRSAGAIDYCADTSLSPTLPDGGTNKRRIGSILRESGAIVAFHQSGDFFRRDTSVLDVSDITPGTNAVTRTLSVPTGIVVFAEVVLMGPQDNVIHYLSPLDSTDMAPSGTNAPLAHNGADASGGTLARAHGPSFHVKTNTTAQIRSRSSANLTIFIATQGWRDHRGRDF